MNHAGESCTGRKSPKNFRVENLGRVGALRVVGVRMTWAYQEGCSGSMIDLEGLWAADSLEVEVDYDDQAVMMPEGLRKPGDCPCS